MTSNTTTTGSELREAVARLCDPQNWYLHDHWQTYGWLKRPDLQDRAAKAVAPSFAKADTILGLCGASASDVTGVASQLLGGDRRATLTEMIEWVSDQSYDIGTGSFSKREERHFNQSRAALLDFLHKLNAALAQSAPGSGFAAQGDGWKPIETAPKDGRKVLIARDMGEPWGWVRAVGYYVDIKGVAGWVPSQALADPPGVLGLAYPSHWHEYSVLPEPPSPAKQALAPPIGDRAETPHVDDLNDPILKALAEGRITIPDAAPAHLSDAEKQAWCLGWEAAKSDPLPILPDEAVERAARALKPFAGDHFDDPSWSNDDELVVVEFDGGRLFTLRVGDFREARAALSTLPPSGKPDV